MQIYIYTFTVCSEIIALITFVTVVFIIFSGCPVGEGSDDDDDNCKSDNTSSILVIIHNLI